MGIIREKIRGILLPKRVESHPEDSRVLLNRSWKLSMKKIQYLSLNGLKVIHDKLWSLSWIWVDAIQEKIQCLSGEELMVINEKVMSKRSVVYFEETWVIIQNKVWSLSWKKTDGHLWKSWESSGERLEAYMKKDLGVIQKNVRNLSWKEWS